MSEITCESDFLKSEISSSIETLKTKSKSNKRKTTLMNAISIALGAIITLTLGVDVTSENITIQKNLALVFGALLTIVSSWNAFFDYKKLWIRQKTTLLALYQLQNELNYRHSRDKKASTDDIFKEYQDIWERDSIEWRSIFQNTKTSNNTSKMKDGS